MLTLLGINKILAIYVGPSGYAAIGQFQNAVQVISTFASGAINTGVTKYTAEYYDDETKQHNVWRTASSIALVGSVITALLIAIFSDSLAEWFLKDIEYSSVFLWFAGTLVLFVLNALLLAILNGKKEIGRYVIANIAGSFFALIVTAVMVVQLGLFGALVALAIFQSLSFFVTLLLCYKAPWFKIDFLLGRFDKQIAINLGKFAAMALTSAVAVPASHILVRSYLGETFGVDAAGYWEAMWRLSTAYLILVSTTLGVYYLPRLSEIKHANDIKLEIIQGYKVILPVAVLSAFLMYFMRDVIIAVLFTKDFTPMRDLFAWQMIGDTLKVASLILGYVLAARAYVAWYILSEILFSMFFYLLVVSLSENYGLVSASLSHAINYFVHAVFMYFVLRSKKVI